MTTAQSEATPTAPSKRLSLSQIVEMLLTRSARDRSAVTIGRTASGEIVWEVTIRTGDNDDVLTAEDAELKANEIAARLQREHPPRNGYEAAEVTLTRNAKGDTQIAMSSKTSDDAPTLDALATRLVDAYDATRRKYPMESGYTAKPGTVK